MTTELTYILIFRRCDVGNGVSESHSISIKIIYVIGNLHCLNASNIKGMFSDHAKAEYFRNKPTKENTLNPLNLTIHVCQLLV